MHAWSMQRALLEFLERHWREAGRGIWEVRGPRAALHALEGDGLGGLRPRGAKAVERVRAARARSSAGARCATRSTPRSCRRGFDASAALHRRRYGSDDLDASLLMMPLDRVPRRRTIHACVATVDAIRARADRRRLRAALPHRARRVDGLPPGEGVFLLCSFWLADTYALTGARRGAARCSSGCSIAQRRRPALRGIRSAHAPAAR